MYVLIVALLAFVLVTPAHPQVHVDIGIHLPAPPQLVVIPEVRAVQYAPAAPANIFFYSGQYWAFANGGWYLSAGYNGPWIVVSPQFVPRPILLVPVNYYRIPPGHWKQWAKHQPPRWGTSGDGSGRRSATGRPKRTNKRRSRVKVTERATTRASNQEYAFSPSRRRMDGGKRQGLGSYPHSRSGSGLEIMHWRSESTAAIDHPPSPNVGFQDLTPIL